MRFDVTPPEPMASSPAFLLSWLGRRTAAEFARALEPLEIRPPQFGLLSMIDAHPGMTQQELVAMALIDPSSMVAMLDDLEQHGLAERRPHDSDRRKHSVHLTPAGRRLLKRARVVANATAERALADLDPAERKQLARLLRKIAGLDP